MKVLFLPELSSNPYQDLLARGLKKYGVEIRGQRKFPNESWLFRHRKNNHVLHIHWPHILYHKGFFPPLFYVLFVERLLLARLLGYKIIWTAHNIMPHERPYPFVDFLIRLLLVTVTQSIIVHCGYAREMVKKKFRRKKNVFIIPHGSYLKVYPNKISKEKARQVLGIQENAFVYLCFGAIRPYKGLEKLIVAFKDHPEMNSNLLIAGRCTPEYGERLAKMIQGDTRIKLFSEFILEERVECFFNAADTMVVPFTAVLTSGSVMLGLTFGLPVIAPALGCLPELISSETGILYDLDDRDSLSRALQQITKMNTTEMGAKAFQIAAVLDWDAIAKLTYQVYTRKNL